MPLLDIDKDKCIGCGNCIDACPFGALSLVDGMVVVNDKCTGCGACLLTCPMHALNLSQERPKATGESLSAYSGVWVWVEQFKGKTCGISVEMLGQGRKLANRRNASLTACVLGHQVEHIAKEAISFGADRVLWVDDEILAAYRTTPYAGALIDLVHQYNPEIFLLGASSRGRDLAGSIASLLYTGLTADCTGLDIDSDSGLLLQTRPAFGGNIMATITCPNHRPQMATVRHHVFEMPVDDPRRQGQVIAVKATLRPEQITTQVVDFILEKDEVNLADARRCINWLTY